MKKVCFIQNYPAKPSYFSRIFPMYIIAFVYFFTKTYFYSLRKGKISSKTYLSLYYLYKKDLNHLNLSRVDNVLLLVKDYFRPGLALVYTTNVYIFPRLFPDFIFKWVRPGFTARLVSKNGSERWCGVVFFVWRYSFFSLSLPFDCFWTVICVSLHDLVSGFVSGNLSLSFPID